MKRPYEGDSEVARSENLQTQEQPSTNGGKQQRTDESPISVSSDEYESPRQVPPRRDDVNVPRNPAFSHSSACNTDGWATILDDPQRESFVRYRKGAFSTHCIARWKQFCNRRLKWSKPCINELDGTLLPRDAGWLVADGCTCKYGYANLSFAPSAMQDWFQELTQAVCQACGVEDVPNSCNINRYNSGAESVGWHADDEELFDAVNRHALIVSLSLGAPRRFELRPRQEGPGGATVHVVLGDGDLCIMGGLCQRHYQHCVPKQPGVEGCRINLTWRWLVCHQRDCPRGMPEGPLRDQLLKLAETRCKLDKLRAKKDWELQQRDLLSCFSEQDLIKELHQRGVEVHGARSQGCSAGTAPSTTSTVSVLDQKDATGTN